MVKISLDIVLLLLMAIQPSRADLCKKMTSQSQNLAVVDSKILTVVGKIECASLCQSDGVNCQIYLYNKITGNCKLVNTHWQPQSAELVAENYSGYFNYGEFGLIIASLTIIWNNFQAL